MIKLVIFDAGDVLYFCNSKCSRRIIKQFLKTYKVSFRLSEKVWSSVKKQAEIGKISLEEANIQWLKKIGLSVKHLSLWNQIDKKIWKKCCKKTPWVNWTLKKLSKKYLIAVLSDSVESSKEKEEKMKLVGIKTNYINKIYTSNDLKAKKPNPKTYLKVIQDFGLNTTQCVFVGHSKDEILGAKRLGILTISLEAKGDYNIKSLRELPKVLDSIEKRRDHLQQKT